MIVKTNPARHPRAVRADPTRPPPPATRTCPAGFGPHGYGNENRHTQPFGTSDSHPDCGRPSRRLPALRVFSAEAARLCEKNLNFVN